MIFVETYALDHVKSSEKSKTELMKNVLSIIQNIAISKNKDKNQTRLYIFSC